jgi:hypothetical protein
VDYLLSQTIILIHREKVSKMSTSLHWSLVNNETTLCYGCNRVATVLSKAFGDLPLLLTEDSVAKLEGMAATWSEDIENPYEKLIELINEHGAIQVAAHY